MPRHQSRPDFAGRVPSWGQERLVDHDRHHQRPRRSISTYDGSPSELMIRARPNSPSGQREGGCVCEENCHHETWIQTGGRWHRTSL
jgi:hypothetical protein